MMYVGSAKLLILELYVYNLERKLPVLDPDFVEFVNTIKHFLMHFDLVLQLAPFGIKMIIYTLYFDIFRRECIL